jgi:hypothetical protein
MRVLMMTGHEDTTMTYDYANDPRIADMQVKYDGDTFRTRVTHVRDAISRLLNDVDRHIERMDEIERVRTDDDRFPTTADTIASRIAHDVLWAIPNMNLENLSHDAHKYDTAIKTRRAIVTTTNEKAS